MINKEIKRVLELAAALVLSRDADVDTVDGGFATVDADIIIQLDCAIASAFNLNGDNVNNKDVEMIMSTLGVM